MIIRECHQPTGRAPITWPSFLGSVWPILESLIAGEADVYVPRSARGEWSGWLDLPPAETADEEPVVRLHRDQSSSICHLVLHGCPFGVHFAVRPDSRPLQALVALYPAACWRPCGIVDLEALYGTDKVQALHSLVSKDGALRVVTFGYDALWLYVSQYEAP